MMEISNNTPVSSPVNPRRGSRRGLKHALPIILGLISLWLLAVAAYYFHTTRLTDEQSRTAAARKESETLQARVDKLETENQTYKAIVESESATPGATSPAVVAAPTQSDAKLTVLAAGYVNPYGSVSSSGSWYGVRLTLANQSTKPIAFNVNTVKLKDLLNNTYGVYGIAGATTFPDGWGNSTIQDQTIAAGATLTGNFVFQLPNASLANFTLVNDVKEYPVSATF